MSFLSIPVEFFIFAATLIAIGIFHRHTLPAAASGLLAVIVYRFVLLGGAEWLHWIGSVAAHEWTTLANIVMVLLGFAVMANHFERGQLPEALPRVLPDNWTGGLSLLGLVFVLSIFLDNIAAAIIGGIMARHYYRGEVGVGFLAAIVAAANAGGAGSVVGDTTTTMMWISGISALEVLPAFFASLVAFSILGPLAAILQGPPPSRPQAATAAPIAIDWSRVAIVLMLLGAIIAVNTLGNALSPALFKSGPWLGIGLWIAIAVTATWRKPDWHAARHAVPGTLFLAALVALAATMPVEALPAASWRTVLGLGFLSAVFDNIPLTALALKQGGYDWALLAYAVGFGGSMMWFGSSAGIALSNEFSRVRSVVAWIRHGWFIPVAYVGGFFALLAVGGWRVAG
jgi:Na+/H+ antiporter NhaD/arsenite permease-like protein